MEKKENYTYGVAYKLYAIENGEKTMLEEAPADQPFRFISGLSMALPTFENNIVKLEENDEFIYQDHGSRFFVVWRGISCIISEYSRWNLG